MRNVFFFSRDAYFQFPKIKSNKLFIPHSNFETMELANFMTLPHGAGIAKSIYLSRSWKFDAFPFWKLKQSTEQTKNETKLVSWVRGTDWRHYLEHSIRQRIGMLRKLGCPNYRHIWLGENETILLPQNRWRFEIFGLMRFD